MVILYTADEILHYGLDLIGISKERQQRQGRLTNVEDFSSNFAVVPVVHATIWEELQTTTIAAARIDTSMPKGNVNLKNFLFAFHFLKVYHTDKQRKGKVDLCEKTASKWCWYFVEKIQALKPLKIVWPKDDEWDTHFIISVDGVHFRFHEVKHAILPRDPSFYSHKYHHAGLSYEFALHLWENRLVWLVKNDKTTNNDRQNFARPGGIRSHMPEGTVAITDRAYRGKGGDPKVSSPNSFDNEELRIFKARARMRQEGFHGRIKRFKCLTSEFNHSVERHETCVEAVSVICVYEMETTSPLTDI